MTSLPWFRMYATTLDNPKAQRLPAEQFRGWVNILCLACRHGGKLPPLADVAFALRMNDRAAGKLLQQLKDAGLLDENEGVSFPHDWDEWQHVGDVSTTRVKAFREREKKRNETVSRNAPDTEQSRADTEQSRAEGGERAQDAPPAPKPKPDLEIPPLLDRRTKADGTAGTRGSRLPADCVLGDEDRRFAESEGFSPDEIDREWAKFRDHFVGAAGARGVKADWPATWRNWVRRAKEDGHVGGYSNGAAGAGRGSRANQPASLVEAGRAVLATRLRRRDGGDGL